MKRLSLQWRITLLTALLIACACVCMNLLLYRTGATGMDALNGFMMQYQPGSEDSLTIEIPQEEMSSLLAHFSQEVYDAKVVFGRKGWCITAVVTILSAAIAYFVSGRALKPLQQLAQQAQRVDQDSIATVRLDEDTVQEFGQLSRSVNRMLDGLAQSFELQRQFAGNAAHELRTPLAILQTKLELFAEEHPAMDAETAGLVSSLREQLDRLTALVRTLLAVSYTHLPWKSSPRCSRWYRFPPDLFFAPNRSVQTGQHIPVSYTHLLRAKAAGLWTEIHG